MKNLDKQDSENLIELAEKLMVRRKWLMFGLIISIVLMVSSFIIRRIYPNFSKLISPNDLRNLGWVLNIFCIFSTAILRRRIKNNPNLYAIFDDEQAKANKTKILMYSYIVLFISTAAATILAVFNNFETKLVLLSVLSIGGVCPPFFFLIFNSFPNFAKNET